MLRALEVRDFVLIEHASLELAAGFSALTGETGAGKSILVDAIELLVGGRADGAFVREGAERSELSGEFDVSKAMESWLAERDLAGDPGSVVLRRSLDRAGRSRCFINGHAATLAQLKDAGEWLVDLHGQHAHQSLLRAAAQRELLDAHAAAEGLARGARGSRWRSARAAPCGGQSAARAIGARCEARAGAGTARVRRGAGRRGGARAAQLRFAGGARSRSIAGGRSAHRGAARRRAAPSRAARRAAGAARRARTAAA